MGQLHLHFLSQPALMTHSRTLQQLITALIPLLFISLQSMGQSAPVPVGERTDWLVDRMDIRGGDSRGFLHTATKPYRRSEVVRWALHADSAGYLSSARDQWNFQYLSRDNNEYVGQATGLGPLLTQDPKLRWLYRERASLLQVDHNPGGNPVFDVRINPVIQLELGRQSGSDELRYVNTRGAEMRGHIDGKVGFYVFATDNQGRFFEHILQRSRDRFQIMPGEGRAKSISSDTLLFGRGGLDYFAVRGGIEFPVTKHIQVSFGQDKRKIGDGYRSLILSDQGKDFLALQIRTRVWKLEYLNLFGELSDYRENNFADGPVGKKYITLHRLGINIGKVGNIGLFESIIFSPEDSVRSGYELHYLNPLIFYRSVEFNLGSIDNIIIGADWKVNFLKTGQFYGQFVLDEFNFSKWREGDGWWANKFGIQAGLKYIDMFGLSNLDGQLEFNTVRPYTYTHQNVANSYTHFSQPLAHPLGANFREVIGRLRWQPINRLDLEARIILSSFGTDSDSLNFGGDIFADSDDRVMEFGNEIGQGVQNDLRIIGLTANFMVWHETYAVLQIGHRRLDSEAPGRSESTTMFMAGIRMNIRESRFDF